MAVTITEECPCGGKVSITSDALTAADLATKFRRLHEGHEQAADETPIRVDHHACRDRWGPGCTTYHGGHECHHTDGHDGKHTCPCGATADNGAQTGGEG